jgi:hypothetical protein
VGRRTVDADELLGLAARLEGHPDNVAAALYGGFTLAVSEDGEQVGLRRFRVPEAWIPVAFIAQAESRTTDMRAALPSTVSHAAAARQAGRSALLATAIMTSDAGLLRAAMRDELHQPYRLPLLPGARELIELAYERVRLAGIGPRRREGLEHGRIARHGDAPAVRHHRGQVDRRLSHGLVPVGRRASAVSGYITGAISRDGRGEGFAPRDPRRDPRYHA